MSLAKLPIKASGQVLPSVPRNRIPFPGYRTSLVFGLAIIELIGLFYVTIGFADAAADLYPAISFRDYLLPGLTGLALALAIACPQGAYSLGVVISFKRSAGVYLSGLVPGTMFCGLTLAEMGAPRLFAWLLPSLAMAASALIVSAARLCSGLIFRRLANMLNFPYRIAVVGGSGLAAALPRFGDQRDCMITSAGYFNSDLARSAPPDKTNPHRGGISELLRLSQTNGLDAIIICLPLLEADAIQDCVRALRQVVVPVYLATGAMETGLLRRSDPLYGLPLTLIQRRPLGDTELAVKAIADCLISLFVLILTAPLLCLIAIIIKLESPGPVLFKQPRVGYNNVVFNIYKFRTMYCHMSDRLAARQTARGDARVTPFGRWLRRFSLDELPQFLNVMRGEMSVVGPRPHAVMTAVRGSLLNQVVADYPLRHRTRPGITGWAQINGARGPIEQPDQIERRTRLDLEYINNWSFWFDLRILLLTPFRILFTSDAF